MNINSQQLAWDKMNGLLPVVVQDLDSAAVLMLAYMNKEALQETLNTGELTLYSRSREQLWRKGSTSGNTMTVRQISTDCDGDSLLVQVTLAGPACHLGFTSCFQPESPMALSFLASLVKVISQRAKDSPAKSYTASLLAEGVGRCAQKVGEEAVEVVIAAVANERDELIGETADLVFHLLVLLQACNVTLSEVMQCLQQRHQTRGLL